MTTIIYFISSLFDFDVYTLVVLKIITYSAPYQLASRVCAKYLSQSVRAYNSPYNFRGFKYKEETVLHTSRS